jgi:hypothetical protein
MHGCIEKTRSEKYIVVEWIVARRFRKNPMDEIKLTRVGRYKIAWDRCGATADRNGSEQADTEKLRRLAELGKQFKKAKKNGSQ